MGLLSLLFLFVAACRGESTTPTAVPAHANLTPLATLPTVASIAPTVTPQNTVTPQSIVVQRVERSTTEPAQLTTRATAANLPTTLPRLAAHLAAVRSALAEPVPILPLPDVDAAQALAQELALQDPRLLATLYDQQTGAPLRNEVFGIYPVRPSDLTPETASCTEQQCYRVEIYHYAYNASTIAMVNLEQATVLTVNQLLDAQPDIPPHLTAVAREIAANAPEVAAALGVKPELMDATMANTKSALNESRCERSRHLCVAPTFMIGERALWAIVDLTEGTVVGIRWTDLGAVGGTVSTVTEKLLQDEVVTRDYCEKSTSLAEGEWQLDYILTSSDGLRISDVRFAGEAVLQSAKLVDWHVSYSNTDGFGYSDAIGCPIFSQAAVVAFNGPQITPIRVGEEAIGFALIQEYMSELWPAPCNYFYSQRYEFYYDGRFRIAFANHGRGCGDNGTYRPVVRIVPAGDYSFAAWADGAWESWETEQWSAPFESATASGYQFRLSRAGASGSSGYWIEPSRGQFDDGGRGDHPYLYVTRHHRASTAPDEGDSDLITIGPCCNTDYQQGPEKFINSPPESLTGAPLVIWYVAQMQNDDTPGQEYCWADVTLLDGLYVPVDYPCYGGPMFVPMQPATKAE